EVQVVVEPAEHRRAGAAREPGVQARHPRPDGRGDPERPDGDESRREEHDGPEQLLAAAELAPGCRGGTQAPLRPGGSRADGGRRTTHQCGGVRRQRYWAQAVSSSDDADSSAAAGSAPLATSEKARPMISSNSTKPTVCRRGTAVLEVSKSMISAASRPASESNTSRWKYCSLPSGLAGSSGEA